MTTTVMLTTRITPPLAGAEIRREVEVEPLAARTCSPANASGIASRKAAASNTAPFTKEILRHDMIVPPGKSRRRKMILRFVQVAKPPTTFHCKGSKRGRNSFLHIGMRSTEKHEKEPQVGLAALFRVFSPDESVYFVSVASATRMMSWKPNVSFLTPWNGSQ
jgi:hypothetical protein